MLQILTFMRKSLISSICVWMLLIWASPPVANGQTPEETGVTNSRNKKRLFVKPLKFRVKSMKKTLHQLKSTSSSRSKKTQTNLPSNQPKRFQVLSPSKQKTAESLADEKAAKIRLERMKLFRSAIHNLMGNPRVSMMYRLAEEYWEHSRYLRLKAMQEHSVALRKWDEKRRRTRDSKLIPKAPQPNLQMSLTYQLQAITVYKRVLGNFPQFPRASEITFTLGLRLMEMNKRRKKEGSIVLLQLLQRWPQSSWTPEVHLALGDYYFQRNKVNDALQQYRSAARSARRVFLRTKTSLQRKKSARGIHLRALYYLAWCRFNVGDYQFALKRFQRVVALSTRYRKTQESRIILRNEALRDMVLAFSKTKHAAKAYAYFRRTVGAKYAFGATQRLARLYFKQGRFVQAASTYKLLMGLRQNGAKDANGPRVPILQARVIQALARVRNPQHLVPEIQKLTAFFASSHQWFSRWHRKQSVWREALADAEDTVREFSTRFHQSAQKEKSSKKKEKLYSVAMKLYEQYLTTFSRSESAYSLRFFWAELMYRKAMKLRGRRSYLPKQSKLLLARAARQYRKVSERKRGEFRRQSAYSEVLCYELLAGRATGYAKLRTAKCMRGSVRFVRGTKLPKPHPIATTSWDGRLLDAYQRYLKVVKGPQFNEDRLQTYFKTGAIYMCYKDYARSVRIFAAMAKEFPQHELSRRAAFMILYGYEDLKRWAALEDNARLFLKDKILTKKKAFRREMYRMLIRSAFLNVRNEKTEKKLFHVQVAQRWLRYEREFGKQGVWSQKGYKVSSAADNALALAAASYGKAKRLFQAIAARKRLLTLYSRSNLRQRVTHELASNYEQIADYQKSARWFEAYVFGSQDYLRLSPQELLKLEQRSRRARVAKKLSSKQRIALQQKTTNALYKAAAYRRGLGHNRRAIRLYQHFMARYPKDRAIPSMILEIARIHEESKAWTKALNVYAVYLKRYQPKGLERVLRRSSRLYQKHLMKHGLVARFFRPKLGNRKAVALFRRVIQGWTRKQASARIDGKLLEVYTRIAAIYTTTKQPQRRLEHYQFVDTLGAIMLLQRHKAMKGLTLARKAFAEARFALVEQRLPSFAGKKFVGSVRRDRVILRQTLQQMRSLAMDYYEVAYLQSPEWVLASIFRVGNLYHRLALKIGQAPIPGYLKPREKEFYRRELNQFVMQMEERALSTYRLVLQKSAQLGLYNAWVKRCERARDALNRRPGRINPHTIFSVRSLQYWLSEPSMMRVTLNLARWAKPATSPLRRRTPPPRQRPALRSTPRHSAPPPLQRRNVLPVRPRGML